MRNPGRSAVRRHIAQPRHHKTRRLVRGQPKPDARPTDQGQRRLQNGPVKAQRQRVIRRLIPRHLAMIAGREILTSRRPKRLGRGNPQRQALLRAKPAGAEGQRQDRGRTPDRQRDPPPRPILRRRVRGGAVLQVQAQVGVILHPRRRVLQPAVPPAQAFGQKPDARPRHRHMRIKMHPRPDDPLHRASRVRNQRADHVHIAVRPAAKSQDGHGQPRPVLTNRPVPPIAIPRLVPRPARRQPGVALQPPHPVAPPVRP